MKFPVPWQMERLPRSVNPYGDRVDACSLEWAKRHRLVQDIDAERRLKAVKPGLLASYCYPTAAGSDLRVLANWISLIFALDGDNGGGYIDCPLDRPWSQSSVVGSNPSSLTVSQDLANPLASALDDILRGVDARMSEQWRLRFRRRVGECFMASVWWPMQFGEVFTARHSRPRVRFDLSAVLPSFDLIEFAAGTAVPADIYHSPIYQRLLGYAVDVVCWTYDLASLDDGDDLGDSQNLVVVLRQAKRISLTDAVEEVVARIGRQVERFLESEEQLHEALDRSRVGAGLKSDVFACVATMKAWMRAQVEWKDAA